MIPKGELRFGECAPNPFGEGEATFWFHLRCAAAKRPQALAVAIAGLETPPAGVEAVQPWISAGLEHDRLSWHGRAERAPSGRARCRSCRALIEKGAWRIALDMWEEGRFAPMGFVHAGCGPKHFGTPALLERLTYLSTDLDVVALESLGQALQTPPPENEPADA